MHGFPATLTFTTGWSHIWKAASRWCTSTSSAGPLGQAAGLSVHGSQSGGRSGELVLVAHNASWPPAIDWVLDKPGRVATLVLLDTYYQ
jgi:hypothetical protein